MKPLSKEYPIHHQSLRTKDSIQKILEKRVPRKLHKDTDRMDMCHEIMSKIPSAKLRLTKKRKPYFEFTFAVMKSGIVRASVMPTYVSKDNLKVILRWPFGVNAKQETRTYDTVDECLNGIMKHSQALKS